MAVRLLRHAVVLTRAQPPHAVRRLSNYKIGVVGVPFNKGQPRPGVSQAPKMLRDAGMIRNLEVMSYNVTDYGDMQFNIVKDDPPSCNIKHPRTMGHASKMIADKVKNIAENGEVVLSLGGDHSMSIGTVSGHFETQPDSVLVWVDAHADINPPLGSMSGNLHGMVLSFLVHELQEYIPHVPGLEWIKPCIHAKDILYLGCRDIDPAERYILEKFKIKAYTMHDIDRHGIENVLEKGMDELNPGLKRPIHLSYDIDALDPSVSPATGTPVPGGMTIREGMFIAEELALTKKLSAIDLVEVNAELGTEKEANLTLYTACEVIAACFGKRRMGNVPKDYVLPKPEAGQQRNL